MPPLNVTPQTSPPGPGHWIGRAIRQLVPYVSSLRHCSEFNHTFLRFGKRFSIQPPPTLIPRPTNLVAVPSLHASLRSAVFPYVTRISFLSTTKYTHSKYSPLWLEHSSHPRSVPSVSPSGSLPYLGNHKHSSLRI
jgi:hypothetical protein